MDKVRRYADTQIRPRDTQSTQVSFKEHSYNIEYDDYQQALGICEDFKLIANDSEKTFQMEPLHLLKNFSIISKHFLQNLFQFK